MVLSKSCMLLFGLILCAVLIAVLTNNYNDAMCAYMSDMVKIKKGGLPKLNSKLVKKGRDDNSKSYLGGYELGSGIKPESFRMYNNEYVEPKSSFINTIPGHTTTLFPPDRTF